MKANASNTNATIEMTAKEDIERRHRRTCQHGIHAIWSAG